jgi:uncharacterized protein YecE (DUF72 family)
LRSNINFRVNFTKNTYFKVDFKKEFELCMEFGKLENIEEVDFSLPNDHPINNLVLNSSLNEINIYVGPTGWSMKEWKGSWYPEKAKPTDFLKYYGQHFNTVEMNTTYYRIPTRYQCEKWANDVPDDFKFAPKISQLISHSNNLGVGTSYLPEFLEALEGFGNKLGACFLQLPEHFFNRDLVLYPRKMEFLHRFLESWPEKIKLHVESRTKTLFSEMDSQDEYFTNLHKFGIGTVITDVAGRRDVLHMGITNKTAFIRFIGNGLVGTDYTRVLDWVVRIKKWALQGLENVYFFCHEPDNFYGPELTKFTVDLFKKEIPGSKIRGPISNDNSQLALF